MVTVELVFKHCAKAVAPSTPMPLKHKLHQQASMRMHTSTGEQGRKETRKEKRKGKTHFSVVTVELVFKHCAKAVAPSTPMRLRFKLHQQASMRMHTSMGEQGRKETRKEERGGKLTPVWSH